MSSWKGTKVILSPGFGSVSVCYSSRRKAETESCVINGTNTVLTIFFLVLKTAKPTIFLESALSPSRIDVKFLNEPTVEASLLQEIPIFFQTGTARVLSVVAVFPSGNWFAF